jgi:DNA mismatch repair protein MSH6
LSKGLESLANVSESFKSKNILGLLRSAPDLMPHIKHVQSMYEPPEKGNFTAKRDRFCLVEVVVVDSDELVPIDGKDEVYDGVMEVIAGLEEELEKELKKFEKKLEWVYTEDGEYPCTNMLVF